MTRIPLPVHADLTTVSFDQALEMLSDHGEYITLLVVGNEDDLDTAHELCPTVELNLALGNGWEVIGDAFTIYSEGA